MLSCTVFSESDLAGVEFDLAIMACGIEKRSVVASRLFSQLRVKCTFVVQFQETISNRRQRSHLAEIKKQLGQTLGVEYREVPRGDTKGFLSGPVGAIRSALAAEVPVRILMDYSSMSRAWYGGLLQYFDDYRSRNVEVYMIYRATNCDDGSIYTDVSNVGTSQFQCGITAPEKPKLVFLGLGFDHLGADSLIQKLECQPVLFYTDPSLGKGITEKILQKNGRLLSSGAEKFPVPIRDLEATLAALETRFEALKDQYSIIVAPLGPKPMVVASILFAIRNKAVHSVTVNNQYNNVETFRDTPLATGCFYRVSFQE